MDKLETLLADLKQLDEKIDNLLAHDELTAEQKAEHDDLVAQRGKLIHGIEKEKDRAGREAERSKLAAKIEKAKAEEAEAEAKREAAKKKQDRILSAGGGRITDTDLPNVRDADRQALSTVPATAKRYGALKNFKGVRQGRNAEDRAYRFGMWAQAMLTLQIPSRFQFTAAMDFYKRNLINQTNNASGSQYLIPEEFSSDLIDLREKVGVARRLLKVYPMTSDTLVIPRRQGGLTANWVGEAAAGTESTKVWDRVRLTAKDLMVLSRYTNQVNADAVINFGDDLSGEVAYAFALAEDKAAFIGTGTSTYGGVQGICNKLDNLDTSGTDSAGLATQGTGSTWGAQVLADFDGVVGLLPQFADTENACWVCHRTYYYTVIEKLIQASGGVPAYEVRQGERRPRPLFKGYPVEFCQVMPSSTATTQVPVILGDLSMGAAFGDRQMDEIAFSEHASIGSENVFERNEIAIRGTERVDINIHDVGSSSVVGPIVGLKTS